MKKTITALILFLISFACIAQTTIPIDLKKLDTINTYEVKQYNNTHRGNSSFNVSTIEYLSIQSDYLGEKTNTIIIKRHFGKFYSNYPYIVKMDTANKIYKIYSGSRLILIYINRPLIKTKTNFKSS